MTQIIYDQSRAGDARPGLRARIAAAIADYRVYRRTIGELEQLTDRELQDLGVSRLSIRDIAYDSVYGG